MNSPDQPCLFCQIVAGQVPSWVVREDDRHLAFLTPFPNTPGVTVVIPKVHAGDYLFRLGHRELAGLIEFSREIVAALETGLGVPRVAMIVEGTGVPHLHVKLYPLHGKLAAQTGVWSPLQVFTREYQGWLTTHEGPRMPDAELNEIRERIRAAFPPGRQIATACATVSERVAQPETWRTPAEHLSVALSHPWFRHVALLQDAVHRISTRFFADRGLRYLMLPLTTSSVSSPVSSASDSLPVRVQMFGRDTYLADSMQFLLEYGVRVCGTGVWYQTLSFRGEEQDPRHLTQFSHIEAEIPGALEDMLLLVEDYIRSLAAGCLELAFDAVRALAGSTAHVEQVTQLKEFPRLLHAEAASYLAGKPNCLAERAGTTVITWEGESALLDKFGPAMWVTHHPAKAVPFYQRRVAGQEEVLSADLLLVGPGEVVGVGERHHRAEDVLEALALQNVPTDEYAWYVEMKRLYPLGTAGFGLGVERFLLWLAQATDIRALQLAPRQRDMHGPP